MKPLNLVIKSVPGGMPPQQRSLVFNKWAQLHIALGRLVVGECITTRLNSRKDAFNATSAVYNRTISGRFGRSKFATRILQSLDDLGKYDLYIQRVK